VLAKQNLAAAQRIQSEHAKKKRDISRFKVGDQGVLSTANLNVGERTRKLTPKYTGPFFIDEVQVTGHVSTSLAAVIISYS